MTNLDNLTDQIENALKNGLTHPGDGNGPRHLALPMINNRTLPAEVAEQFAKDADLPHADIPRLIAEALTHTINSHTQPQTPAPKVTTPEPPTQLATDEIKLTVNGHTTVVSPTKPPPRQLTDQLKNTQTCPAWVKATMTTIAHAITTKTINHITITTTALDGFTLKANQ